MGRSRRKMKRSAPKVRVGLVKRKKTEKTKVPKELTEQRPALEARLKQKADWDEEVTLSTNYKHNNFVLDPNKGVGRNSSEPVLKSKEQREAAQEETFSDDDEIRAACNKERKTGKALPPKLTSTQRGVISKLLEKHGDDVHAMMLDTKVNKMQHSEGQLKKLIEAYHFWKPGSGHDFWGPQKPYKRL